MFYDVPFVQQNSTGLLTWEAAVFFYHRVSVDGSVEIETSSELVLDNRMSRTVSLALMLFAL